MRDALMAIAHYKLEMQPELLDCVEDEQPWIDPEEYSMCSPDTQKLGDIYRDIILCPDCKDSKGLRSLAADGIPWIRIVIIVLKAAIEILALL